MYMGEVDSGMLWSMWAVGGDGPDGLVSEGALNRCLIKYRIRIESRR